MTRASKETVALESFSHTVQGFRFEVLQAVIGSVKLPSG